MKNTLIISAFPCCGKTYDYEHQCKYSVLDSDSSQFSWIKDEKGNNTKERNPYFPENYIQHIKENIGKVDAIYVSSHLVVRQALEDAGIDYITVYPKTKMINEWVGRMYRRGDSKEFIDVLINNWDNIVSNIHNEPHGSAICRLGNSEYIRLSELMYFYS